MKMKKRGMSSLAKKRRKANSRKPGLMLESLEERQMLTAQWLGSGATTFANEGGLVAGNTEPTIFFSPAAPAGTVVNIGLTTPFAGGGTTPAVSPDDFTVVSFVLPQAVSGNFGLISNDVLQIANDQLVEGDEAIGLQLLGSSVGVIGTTTTTHIIQDNETATVEIGNDITEGSSGATIELVTSSPDLDGNGDPLPAVLEDSFSVAVQDNGGTATVGNNAGDDVQDIADATVTFGPGLGNGQTVPFTVQTNSDSLVEGTETVTFSLTPNVGHVGVSGSTLNVLDAQSASLSFSNTQAFATEDSTNANTFVSVVLSLPQGGTLASALTVPVDTNNGTASEAGSPTSSNPNGDDDFVIVAPTNSTSITFPAGSSNGTAITYEIEAESGLRDDDILEGNETVILELGTPSLGSVGNGTFTMTIVDDEFGALTITRASENVTEGQNIVFNFEVNATGSSAVGGIGQIVVPYTLTGSASPMTNNSTGDFSSGATGTVTIPANSGSTTSMGQLTLSTVQDLILEGDETVTLNVASSVIGLNVSGSPVTTTIQDNDSGTVYVRALTSTGGGDNDATEDTVAFGSVNGTNGATATSDDAVFEIALSNASSTATTVELESIGSATPGVDFAAFPQFVTIPAGDTVSASITLEIFDDNLVEATEDIGIRIKTITSGDPQLSIGAAASIDINDTPDATNLTVTASDPLASEVIPNTGAGVDNGQFLFQLSNPADVDITANFTIAGSASPGGDYSALPATLLIPAGATFGVLNVNVIDDAIGEGGETVTLQLTSVSSSALASQVTFTGTTETVTIADNDGVNASLVVVDGDAGEDPTPANSTALGIGQVRVELSNPSNQQVTLDTAITGSATVNSDFTTTLPSTITIAANSSTSATYDFTILPDSLIEGDETIIVTLSNPSAGIDNINVAAGTITITDNDSAGVTVSAPTPAGENGGVGRFEFGLNAASTTDTTVNFSVGGTAVRGVDYQLFTANPGANNSNNLTPFTGNSIVIGSGSTGPVLVYVLGLNDTFVEGDETIVITPTSTSNSGISVSGSATNLVVDDDSALVTLVVVDDEARENPNSDTAQFRLDVDTNQIVVPMNVQFTLTGVATDSDVIIGNTTISGSTGSIFVPAGTTSVTLPITAINDFFVEGTEDLTIALTGITGATSVVGGVGIDPAGSSASADILDDDTGAEVFLTFQSLADLEADEEDPSNTVPIFIGLTQPSSQATTVSFSVGSSAAANNNDAEFSNNPGSSGIGQDDFYIGQTDTNGNLVQLTPSLDTMSGRYVYTVTIPAFGSSAVVQVVARPDGAADNEGVVEGTEFVNIALQPNAAANYTNSANLSQVNPAIVEGDVAVITIEDHDNSSDEPGAFSSIIESGSANATITVLSDIEGELDVFYQYVDGSATAATDYDNFGGGIVGSFVFVNTLSGATAGTGAAGSISPVTLPLQPTNDSVFEGTEQFQVQLLATHSNGGLTDQLTFASGDSASIEILDDDQITIGVGQTFTENNTTVPVTVTLNSGAPVGTYQISTAQNAGSATAGTDFTGFVGSAFWDGTNWTNTNSTSPNSGAFDTDGDSVLEFSVGILEDVIVEGNQVFNITVTPPNNSIATSILPITIVDEDTLTLTANDVAVTEGGTVNTVIATDLAIEGTVTFTVDVVAGTAVEEDTSTTAIEGDFNPVTATEFTLTGTGANATLTTVAVNTSQSNDTIVEGDETATISLTGVSHSNGGAITVENGAVTINETGQESITFTVDPTSITVTEGAPASVAVKLVGSNGATGSVPITVNPVTANGAAVGGAFGGQDFTQITAGGQPLNFSGALNQELTAVVLTIDDNVVEAQENFTITFPAADISINTGASVTAPASVGVTVNDNDSADVEIRSETAGTEGGSDGTFEVGFTNGRVTDVDVFVSISVGGTATPASTITTTIPTTIIPNDFDLSTPPPFTGSPFSTTAPSYIAVIPAGQTGAVVTVDIFDDTMVENTETVTLTGTSVIPAATRSIGLGSDNTGTVNINDDDGVTTASTFSVSGTTWNTGPAPVANGANLPWRGINQLNVGFAGGGTPPSSLSIIGTLPTLTNYTASLVNVTGGVANYVISGPTIDLPSGRYRVVQGGNTVLNFEVTPADGTLDGSVGFADFAAMAAAFGTATGAGAAPSVNDYDANGSVGFSDFALLAANFGTNVNSFPAPAPPSSPVAVDDVFAAMDDDDDDEFDIFG